MKIQISPLKLASKLAIVFLAIFTVAVLGTPGHSAEESKFRKDFLESYQKNAFKALEFMIRQNASKVPAEVDAIIEDAQAEGLSYPERMGLVDIAVTMASMHKEWNKDPKPLAKAEALQKKLLKEEQARQEEIKKWKAYELVLGNWVMKENKDKMDAEGIPYALYPHWLHQIFFECRVCHTGIFIPKRGANNINKDRILKGEICGKCHNGEFAFEAKTNCKRCHVVGEPGEERLRDVNKVDMEMIKSTAKRLGVGWHQDRLPNNVIPVDKYNFVDWAWLNKMEVYKSISSVKGISEPPTEERDTKMLYPSPFAFVKDAVFDHDKHTPRMLCAHCHPLIFDKGVGSKKVRMSEMGEGNGKSCGYCHGKTAFKLADCNKCHTHGPDEPRDGFLVSHPKQ